MKELNRSLTSIEESLQSGNTSAASIFLADIDWNTKDENYWLTALQCARTIISPADLVTKICKSAITSYVSNKKLIYLSLAVALDAKIQAYRPLVLQAYEILGEDHNILYHMCTLMRYYGRHNDALRILQNLNRRDDYLWWTNAIKSYLAQGQIDLAVKCGRKIFEILYKQIGLSAAPNPRKTQYKEEFKSGKKNYISFSLFGDDEKYARGAIENVKQYADLMPGWIPVFYIDQKYNQFVIEELNKLGSIVILKERRSRFDGLFWRFEAFSLEDAFRVLVRDADSLPTTREVSAVKAWVNSTYRYHLIRDHPEHAELILAGLFGGIAGNIEFSDFQSYGLNDPNKWADQEYLRRVMYKKILHSVYVSDQFYSIEPISEKIPTSEQWIEKYHLGGRLFT